MIHATLILAALSLSAATPNDLIGRVVDAAGKPIPQATVFIYTARPRIGVGGICPGCYADCRKKAATDGEGKYRIADLDPELIFRVLVVAEGFRPEFAHDVDPRRGGLDLKLAAMPSVLAGRVVLRGRVLGPDGKPVVGAVVSPEGCKRADRQWGGQLPGVDPASVTNLRGEFFITGNPGDLAYDVVVEGRGLVKRHSGLLPTGDTAHEIRMIEGATLHGRILIDGKPLARETVSLVQCDLGGDTFIGCHCVATDAEGRYTFVNLRPNDDYYVFITMGDAARLGKIMAPKRVSVGGDGTTTEAGDGNVSDAIHRVSGRVILTDGKPAAKNTRMSLSRTELGWDVAVCVVGDDGSFSFAGVPEEAVELSARIPGYRLASKRNRFQQTQPWAVATMVDGDRSGLEIYYEPEPAAQSAGKK
jgi:hypothetical protein